ncbi:hypothetical protein PLESTB_000213600 [Pleodorina starrii]|uniref:Peptidase S8/S53 domain-containing protein n=1 Tax=Pleodorina starrii TaxID=330485 RepID=A0A9W6BC77_9CHLO|nr:hypothetical protein PLESTM_001539300 [Pleodorina starrii]GLC49384.1 hypothetical protein PLESTB_000213600 [Pleodorina starrii]GLC73354.1 hypothetical protein PLESTF_001366400 [Pleodorina starrii]
MDTAARIRSGLSYAEYQVGDQLQTEAEETEASQQQASSGGARSAARRLPEQLDPVTWGLDRIDQAKLPLDQIYHYDSVGTGVHVYILDSGIRATHQQFRIMAPAYIQKQGQPIQTVNGTRVVAGFSAYGGTGPDSTTDDCFGHGTHVAATIGGLDNGVAKNVTLHPVKASATQLL